MVRREHARGSPTPDVSAVEQVICAAIKGQGPSGPVPDPLRQSSARRSSSRSSNAFRARPSSGGRPLRHRWITVAAPRLVEAKPTTAGGGGHGRRHERRRGGDARAEEEAVERARARPPRVGGAGGTGAGANPPSPPARIGGPSSRFFRLAGEAFNKPAVIAGGSTARRARDTDGESDFSYVSLAGGGRYHLLLRCLAILRRRPRRRRHPGAMARRTRPLYAGDAPSRERRARGLRRGRPRPPLRTHLVAVPRSARTSPRSRSPRRRRTPPIRIATSHARLTFAHLLRRLRVPFLRAPP